VTGHPLDPLSADEICQAASILRRDRGVGPRRRIGVIELHEPPTASLDRNPALDVPPTDGACDGD
jgi:primary-amine oxidase